MILDIIAAVITYAAVGVGAWFIGGYMLKVYQRRARLAEPRRCAPSNSSPTR